MTTQKSQTYEANLLAEIEKEEERKQTAPLDSETKAMATSSSPSPDAKMEAAKEVLSAAVNPVDLAKRIRDLASPQNRHKIKEGVKRAGGDIRYSRSVALNLYLQPLNTTSLFLFW
jgi:hypothetical protein